MTCKSMIVKAARACALARGHTARIPFNTRSFNISNVDGAQLVWEEEAQNSPILAVKHTDLMPLNDGDYRDCLVTLKGTCKPSILVMFRSHVIFASNSVFNQLIDSWETSSQCAIVSRMLLFYLTNPVRPFECFNLKTYLNKYHHMCKCVSCV